MAITAGLGAGAGNGLGQTTKGKVASGAAKRRMSAVPERGPATGRGKAERSTKKMKRAVPGSETSWPRILSEAQKRFGIKGFRSGQKEVLEEVFAGRSVLGLMPTGSGKTLTYQLPAVFLKGPVVVVSPLIALMQDQQERAQDAHLVVEKMDSTLTAREIERAEHDIDTGKAQLVYVTPERLEKREFLNELNAAGGVALLVVDEAHCISQWGHDFRPAYLAIGDARKKLGMPPVLALTATATHEVVQEILENLHATDAKVVNAGTERENLHFAVHHTVNRDAKLACLTSLLERETGTGIIYTSSVRTADELHDWLKEHGISVGRYHGKMKAHDREHVQQEFMRGDHKVMIATKAFGLGIDKADIRFVFHYEFPDSLETYYQEAGRAGRDGLPSRAALLYRLEDKRIQSFFLAGRYPRVEDLRKVLEAMADRVLAADCNELTTIEVVPALAEAAGESVEEARDELTARREGVTLPPDTIDAERKPVAAKGTVVSEAEISERSGVGKKKTEVILHLLREARIIARSRRGYVLKHTDILSDEVLGVLLTAYVERAQHDHTRLDEMMHYAETVDCRVQVIRRYFGDPAGGRCGRCDNCEQAANGFGGHTERVLTDARAQTTERVHDGRVDLAAGTETHRADEPHDGGVVTRRETMHGTIVTTSPETLPHREAAPSFAAGDLVHHVQFGEGTVRQCEGDTVTVHFRKGGVHKLKASFLTRSR